MASRQDRTSVETGSCARSQRFFASCPTGLEEVLGEEVRELGGRHMEVGRGGVSFEGPLELCYRVNLESRIASRVLWRVHRGPYRTEADVQDAVRALPWADWFEPTCTIRIRAENRPLRSRTSCRKSTRRSAVK